MSEPIRQESPLIERNTAARRQESPTDAGVTVRERPFLAYINLRGDAGDSEFANAVRNATAVDLPTEPNTVSEGNDCHALWLSPDEWYLVAAAGREQALVEQLERALSGQPFAVNDLTSGLTTIEISGPRVRDVIAKGCTLDLHARAFGPGQCAQTLISHAVVVIRCVDSAPVFEITVRRSFADFLWAWLEDAALEYGMAVSG